MVLKGETNRSVRLEKLHKRVLERLHRRHTGVAEGDEFPRGISRTGSRGAQDKRKTVKKIEAIIPPAMFELLRTEVLDLSIDEIAVSEVRSYRRRNVARQFYRGTAYEVLLPMVKVEMIVPASAVADVTKIFSRIAQQVRGGFEDKLLVFDLAEAVFFPGDADIHGAIPRLGSAQQDGIMEAR